MGTGGVQPSNPSSGDHRIENSFIIDTESVFSSKGFKLPNSSGINESNHPSKNQMEAYLNYLKGKGGNS